MENFQKNATAAIAGVCRQLSNAYLNSSNVNVLLAGRNVIVSRLATLVGILLQSRTKLDFWRFVFHSVCPSKLGSGQGTSTVRQGESPTSPASSTSLHRLICFFARFVPLLPLSLGQRVANTTAAAIWLPHRKSTIGARFKSSICLKQQ